MTREDLTFFRTWFMDFCRSFYSSREEDQRNILLKEEHTRNVCENMRLIAAELSLKNGELLLAETIALFHDVGRFPQYAEHRTFSDAVSVNHAVLGATVLADAGILAGLSPREREIVLNSVRFHNAFALPDIADRDALLFLRLIRDADKLDIWRIFVEYYESPGEEKASATEPGLPHGAGYSADVLSCIFGKRVASLSCLKTVNDFKLMQLSWIYDLNFDTSLKLLLAREYIDRIVKTLPPADEIRRVSSFLGGYIRERLQAGG